MELPSPALSRPPRPAEGDCFPLPTEKPTKEPPAAKKLSLSKAATAFKSGGQTKARTSVRSKDSLRLLPSVSASIPSTLWRIRRDRESSEAATSLSPTQLESVRPMSVPSRTLRQLAYLTASLVFALQPCVYRAGVFGSCRVLRCAEAELASAKRSMSGGANSIYERSFSDADTACLSNCKLGLCPSALCLPGGRFWLMLCPPLRRGRARLHKNIHVRRNMLQRVDPVRLRGMATERTVALGVVRDSTPMVLTARGRGAYSADISTNKIFHRSPLRRQVDVVGGVDQISSSSTPTPPAQKHRRRRHIDAERLAFSAPPIGKPRKILGSSAVAPPTLLSLQHTGLAAIDVDPS